MIKRLFTITLTATLVYSCNTKPDHKKLIIGTWHTVRVDNKDKDNFFKSSQEFIDTMGKGNTDDVNIEIYGVANVDSLRKQLQLQFDSAFAAQASLDTQSVFTFSADGKVKLLFPGREENGQWHIDGKGRLVLDEKSENGDADHMAVEIAALDANTMKLVFVREVADGVVDTSAVTFRKEGK